MTDVSLPPVSNARSLPRTRLLMAATLRVGRASQAIRLRDLSASGARIEGKLLPPVGSEVRVVRGSLEATGRIIWGDRANCGLTFDPPIAVDDWLPNRPQNDHGADDRPIDRGTRRAPSSLALGDVLPHRLAEELAYVVRLLDSLGSDLCAEPLVVARHGTALQNLDIGAQIIGHIAAVLTADDPEATVNGIGMVDLRKRLSRGKL